jgi:hypothetical protein
MDGNLKAQGIVLSGIAEIVVIELSVVGWAIFIGNFSSKSMN